MKKVLLAAIVLMSTQAGFSQINQGQWLAGGNAGFSSSKQGNYKSTTITVSPDAGYFFIDHLAGGLRFNYNSIKPDGETTESYFSVAPFARYYFLPSGQQVNIFADAEYGFGSGKASVVQPLTSKSESLNEFTISAGPAVFLSPNTALEFAAYYSSYGGDYYTGGGSDRANTFGLKIGFQVHLGGGTGKK